MLKTKMPDVIDISDSDDDDTNDDQTPNTHQQETYDCLLNDISFTDSDIVSFILIDSPEHDFAADPNLPLINLFGKVYSMYSMEEEAKNQNHSNSYCTVMIMLRNKAHQLDYKLPSSLTTAITNTSTTAPIPVIELFESDTFIDIPISHIKASYPSLIIPDEKPISQAMLEKWFKDLIKEQNEEGEGNKIPELCFYSKYFCVQNYEKTIGETFASVPYEVSFHLKHFDKENPTAELYKTIKPFIFDEYVSPLSMGTKGKETWTKLINLAIAYTNTFKTDMQAQQYLANHQSKVACPKEKLISSLAYRYVFMDLVNIFNEIEDNIPAPCFSKLLQNKYEVLENRKRSIQACDNTIENIGDEDSGAEEADDENEPEETNDISNFIKKDKLLKLHERKDDNDQDALSSSNLSSDDEDDETILDVTEEEKKLEEADVVSMSDRSTTDDDDENESEYTEESDD